MDDILILYSTAPDMATAENLSKTLVEAGLAACVNLIPGMVSIYRWKGAIERGDETVMIVKTTKAAAGAARELILREHPYENPAILAISIDAKSSSNAFLDWIRKETGRISPDVVS